jgi:hypothetical protein
VQPIYFILGAVALSLALLQVNRRAASPVIAIIDRWLRWLIIAFGAAEICRLYDLIDRPFWVLAAAFFLVWFVIETLYTWLEISALSVSPLPLFPRYVVNPGGAEWPVQPRLLKIREWLRAEGFHSVQALRAEGGRGLYLRVSVYQDEAATVRIELTFLPQSGGSIVVCSALTSIAEDGTRYLTDNLYIPFAGFYPENWLVERRPWCRSLPRMLARHRARLAAAGARAVPFAIEPLADLNAGQHELDLLNTELGFLHPHHQRDDFGKITHEGRYRVWKEFWMLNYLGRSSRYR